MGFLPVCIGIEPPGKPEMTDWKVGPTTKESVPQLESRSHSQIEFFNTLLELTEPLDALQVAYSKILFLV